MDPAKSLDALLDPGQITLGQLAILDKMDSPLLCGLSTKFADLAPGLFSIGLEPEAAFHMIATGEIYTLAKQWPDEVGMDTLLALLDVVSDVLSRFWQLLPKPDAEQKPRPGNGLFAELAEWYARTYRLPPSQVIWKEPALRVALFFRVWSQSVGGNKTATLGQELESDEDLKTLQALCKDEKEV